MKNLRKALSFILITAMIMTSVIVVNQHMARADNVITEAAYVGRQGENLLRGKTATASNVDTDGNHYPENAVDGDNDTVWATIVDIEQAYLEIDLGEPARIESFVLYWERAGIATNINKYEILVSEDGDSFVEVFRQERKNKDKEHKIDLAEPVTAAKVRLLVTDFDKGLLNNKNIGLREIEAYSHDTSLVPPRIKNLKELKRLTVDETLTAIVFPKIKGELGIISSSQDQVVATDGSVYQPLTDRDVKVTVQWTHDGETETKEVAVFVPGIYPDEGVNAAPNIIPTIQQWHGREGNTVIGDSINLVVDAAFASAGEELRRDLEALGVQVGTDNSGKRIELRQTLGKGYAAEGYYIDISDGVITVEAETDTGAYHATRSLLQMGDTLPNGEIKDYPKYDVRGFMIDTGRSFIPYRTMIHIVETMGYYKMNDLHIHLNDNYIWMADHGNDIATILENAESHFRLESDIVGENGVRLTSDDHYTDAEFRAIVQRATELGIKLIPEFDVPAHSMAFIKVRPDLMYQGPVSGNDTERAAMFDLSNPASLDFIKTVFNEQMDGPDPNFAGLDTVHFGADEYHGGNEEYRRFVSDMIGWLKRDKQVTPRLWGSLKQKKGNTPIDGTGVEMNVWNLYWMDPQLALDMHFDIINTNDSTVYIVPNGSGNRGSYKDFLNLEAVYDWSPNKFDRTVIDESHPQLRGGSFAVWQDNIDFRDTGLTSYDIFRRFFDALPVVAERTWDSQRSEAKYADFKARADQLLAERPFAPRSNPLYRYDFETLDGIETFAREAAFDKVDHVSFEGAGRLLSDLDGLGPDYAIDLKIKLDDVDTPQILFTNGKDTFYLADDAGQMAYAFEKYTIVFDKKLEPGKVYEIRLVGTVQETELYVDDVRIEKQVNPRYPNIAYRSLIMPLAEVGTNSRMDLYRLDIRQDTSESPGNGVKTLLDLSPLRAKLAEAKAVDGSNYQNYDELLTAIESAEAFLDDYESALDTAENRAALEAEIAKLDAAIKGLIEVEPQPEVDKQNLAAAIEAAKSALDNSADFTPESVAALEEALAAAEAVYADETATQPEVDAAEAALRAALDALELKPETPKRNGWYVIDGDTYYFIDDVPVVGHRRIGNTFYLFDRDGKRRYGWHVVGGKHMYFDPDNGGQWTGLRTIGKTTYMLSVTHGKLSGWYVVGGRAMYFDPNYGCGRVTGKRTIGNTTYLLTANGKQCGWHVLGGEKYYFAPEYGCGMLTGLRKVGTGTYFFRTEASSPNRDDRGAALRDGSVTINGKVYRFNKSGVLVP